MVGAKEPQDMKEILEESRRRNVKEILVEMKDLSELIIDLAYSALLYDNEELAEDVVELEEYLNKLKYEIEIKTMVAARTDEEATTLTPILHIATAAEDISNAARELVDAVQRDVSVHPILATAIKEANETTEKFTVYDGSKLAGKSLKQLKLESKTGMKVIALKRGREWFSKINKNTEIRAGDIIIVRGPKESIETVDRLRGAPKK